MAKSAEYGLGDYAFPRGWFAVANSSELDRKPLSVHYFGQDMVLYRGASGRAVMLDAWCPHMGTHLGSGENSATTRSETHMEDDNIRCPFHAWRFGADGVCNQIPYHDGPIPPQARVKSWHIEERYNIVFAWHDPEGLAPDYPLPDYPEWDDPSWIPWPELDHLCDLQHPIEILDNMSDVAHLDHLHGSMNVLRYENEYDGYLLHQRQSARLFQPLGQDEMVMTTLSGYVGPGLAFGQFLEIDARQFICVTPIDDGTCRMWQAGMVRSPSGVRDEAGRTYREGLNHTFGNGLLRDGEIWATKRPALKVMQMPSDGPFRQTRIWYSQFYNPRARADEIVARVAGRHYAKNMPPFTEEAEAAE